MNLISFFIKNIILFCWLLFFAGTLHLLSLKNGEEQSSNQKTLRIFCWSDSFDPVFVEKFEKTTGAKVKFSYYDNNGELIVKLRITKGRGYDIIVPSDVGVDILAKEGLLKKIQKERLSFFSKIDPLLLNHYFDPQNQYSIPLEWSIVGLGYSSDHSLFSTTPPDWNHLLNPTDIPGEVVMMNDPREVIQIAGHYLFPEKSQEKTPTYSAEELVKIKEVLRMQFPYVHCYTDARADYLLATHNAPLAVTSSSYTWRTMLRYPHMHFHVPESGGFLNIENVALSAQCANLDLAYEFINFMYAPESVQWHFEKYGYFPALYIDEILSTIDQETIPKEMLEVLRPNAELFKRLHFFRSSIDEEKAYNFWIGVKSLY